MVKLIKDEYTFTEEQMTELLNDIVTLYSRKKFTEDDLKRVIDGGKNRQELLESKRKEYNNIAYNLREKEEIKETLDDFTKMELTFKNKHKIWMYKVEEDILVIKEGLINKKLKEETINFNDEDQLECYLNKQIILKKNRGYVEI